MKLTRKRGFVCSMMLMVMFFLYAVPAFAEEDAIPSITVEVLLQEDGSAAITEVWDIQNVYDGTEYYKAVEKVEDMKIHSLRVQDETGKQYESMESWNTKLSREEKAGKSGILQTDDGYELCWGIGDYGNRRYTIQYTIDGLVKNYGDYAGFYFRFISELSSAPEYTFVKVKLPEITLTQDNARIWGYGYEGEVQFSQDGSLVAFSSEPLGGSDYVNLLCRFDKSLFPSAAVGNMSFEELQKMAEDEGSLFPLLIVFPILAIIIFLAVFFASRYKLSDGTVVRLPKDKLIEPNWSIPMGGSIAAVYALLQMLRRGTSCDTLLAAYLIRWQEKGYIQMEERERIRKIGKAKKEEVIVFHAEKVPSAGTEKALYNILAYGADENGILWTSAIEKWAEKLYEKLEKWSETVHKEGEEILIRSGMAAKDKHGTVRFTASGFEQGVKLIGFQKYLKQMKQQGESEIIQRELWGDYLVFAALFSIGEEVLKSLKALDPAYFEHFSGMYGYDAYYMMHFMSMTNHISSTAAVNTDGTGGAASSGGGGGFSGGGGGGSR